MQNQNANTIRDIFESHKGKVSDKWSSYLEEYERLFHDIKENPVSLLEIGIQNGGSLEIWGKYFGKAEKLIGCDINENCRKLSFDDRRMAVIVGDANTDAVQRQIEELSPSFDIVIDDGSHKSGDIIQSFARYFPLLKPGGIFLAEDLHCSYWKEFEGGLFDPLSSISFFKDLADIISHEHWGIPESRRMLLEAYSNYYKTDFKESDLAEIRSVEFLNSICVVRKGTSEDKGLGIRRLSGSSAEVFAVKLGSGSSGSASLDGAPDQSDNEWSRSAMFQQRNSVAAVAKEISGLHAQISELNLELQNTKMQLAGKLADLDGANHEIKKLQHTLGLRENSLSWKITRPLRWMSNAILRK